MIADSPTSDDAEIVLCVPAQPEFVRVARLTTSAVASLVGFDIDAIDDLRIGVDELCSALIEHSDGKVIELRFAAEAGRRLRISGAVPGDRFDPTDERLKFSLQILSVVADDHGFDVATGRTLGWLVRDVEGDVDAAGDVQGIAGAGSDDSPDDAASSVAG